MMCLSVNGLASLFSSEPLSDDMSLTCFYHENESWSSDEVCLHQPKYWQPSLKNQPGPGGDFN